MIVIKRVYLDPKFLDTNIMKHLLDKCTELYVGECTKENGHILSVKRIVNVIKNEDTVFTVSFEVDALKPKAGDKLFGTVCMLFKDGIFAQVSEKQKILIPAVTIKDYIYDDASHTYLNENKKIKVGDNIEAIVTAAQYSKKNFSCIGCLV